VIGRLRKVCGIVASNLLVWGMRLRHKRVRGFTSRSTRCVSVNRASLASETSSCGSTISRVATRADARPIQFAQSSTFPELYRPIVTVTYSDGLAGQGHRGSRKHLGSRWERSAGQASAWAVGRDVGYHRHVAKGYVLFDFGTEMLSALYLWNGNTEQVADTLSRDI
jgi:hypothetical protein